MPDKIRIPKDTHEPPALEGGFHQGEPPGRAVRGLRTSHCRRGALRRARPTRWGTKLIKEGSGP